MTDRHGAAHRSLVLDDDDNDHEAAERVVAILA